MNGGLIKSCELVARVRSGRVVKAGSNGIVMYNSGWYEKHRDTELRGRGCGDPSPEDIRSISGWIGTKVSHSGADTSDPEVIPVSWQTEVGTDYAGILNVTTGVLTLKNDEDEETRKRGTWKEFCVNGRKHYECSKCGCAYPIKHLTCPNCKTRMALYLKTNGTEDEK